MSEPLPPISYTLYLEADCSSLTVKARDKHSQYVPIAPESMMEQAEKCQNCSAVIQFLQDVKGYDEEPKLHYYRRLPGTVDALSPDGTAELSNRENLLQRAQMARDIIAATRTATPAARPRRHGPGSCGLI